MSVKSFAKRRAEAERRDVLDTLTLTERLLVNILIELMETRAHRNQAEIAERLTRVGLSTKQIAAVLDTTPETLAVAARRQRIKADPDPPTGRER